MTATDELLVTGYPNSLRPELHKALKARGIDYWVAQGITFWNRDDGCECLAYGYEVNGVPKLAVKVVGFTDPEQAIAATLGTTDPRERGLIPHFWTGDWTLHVETARLPERIDVTLPDERGREVHSARVHRFVPERTCRIEERHGDWYCTCCGEMVGTCDTASELCIDGNAIALWSFCPNCGAKVVDLREKS